MFGKTRLTAIAMALGIASGPALSQDMTAYTFDGAFDDATFNVESAIVGRGLVIDYVSHVGEMLDRTGSDVGSDIAVFDNADIFLFCSAVLSRKVMEADPANIRHCPYAVFVTDRDGQIEIGYRHFPDGPMQDVQALLDDIAREAAEQ